MWTDVFDNFEIFRSYFNKTPAINYLSVDVCTPITSRSISTLIVLNLTKFRGYTIY